MKKIISVVGARPNFMKVAPLHKAFVNHKTSVKHLICHTGQHFDEKMSKIFFTDLELPQPDFYLGVGSATHAVQTARIMMAFEEILLQENPDCVIVVGDVNSTLACALVASKLHIKVAHVEAGLRSFDNRMPEEINRKLTDTISDYLFISEPSGLQNLKNEGINDNKLFFVGNIMIDSLLHYLPKTGSVPETFADIIQDDDYVLVTFHRPSNVDNKENLTRLFSFLNAVAKKRKVVFPVHPRTRKNMKRFGLEATIDENILLSEPIGYIGFLTLIKNAGLVITDSGGIQEETTFLGVPCITVRKSTERPVTVDVGTNILAGIDFEHVKTIAFNLLEGNKKKGNIPELWDGKTAHRIVDLLLQKL